MQQIIKKSFKIFLYAVFAVFAVVFSFFFGGGKQYHLSDYKQRPPNDDTTATGVPIAHADSPDTGGGGPDPVSLAGSEGGGSEGSEGCEGCEGGN